jgi:hypothetical protein
MRVLVRNEANHGEERLQHPRQQDRNSSNSEFLSNHPPVFLGARDLLDVDYWLCTTESKFRLLHCTEYQKTLYAAQQLRRSIGAWWASYLAALPADHHVAWDEFRVAFVITTCQWAPYAASLSSSWSYNRGIVLCMTTPRSSTT